MAGLTRALGLCLAIGLSAPSAAWAAEDTSNEEAGVQTEQPSRDAEPVEQSDGGILAGGSATVSGTKSGGALLEAVTAEIPGTSGTPATPETPAPTPRPSETESVPRVLWAYTDRDPDGPCYRYRSGPAVEAPADVSLLNQWNISVTSGERRCAPAPGTERVDPDAGRGSLIARSEEFMPVPAPTVQPSGQPITGKPVYVSDDTMATPGVTGAPFDVSLDFGGGLSINAAVTLTLERYWVDWERPAGPNAPEKREELERSGPFTERARAWSSASSPGNVGKTYGWPGSRAIVVIAEYRVNASISGLGALTPAYVTVESAPMVIDVREAQAVRQS